MHTIETVSIPEHDRRILERLAAKLWQEQKQIALSQQNTAFWEREQDFRNKIRKQHDEEYKDYLFTKRQAETDTNTRKKLWSQEIEEWQREILLERINKKDILIQQRLQNLETQKIREISQKKERAKNRSKNVMESILEKTFDEFMWRKNIFDVSALRISVAVQNRKSFLHFLKQRTNFDNKIHEEIQKRNWDEIKMQEKEDLDQLKKYLYEKTKKMEKIENKKNQALKRSRHIAKLTAQMRENLRFLFNRNNIINPAEVNSAF